VVLLPGLLGPYGPFIDELYYVSCAERPALGYVDHPPLAPLLLRASRAILGEGMLALRLPPALAGAALVLLVGWMARRLGAGPLGQGLACGGVLGAPVLLALFGFYSMNAFEVLLWAGLTALLIEIERRDEARLWLVFGGLAGLALLNKHTTVLLAGGLAVGVLLTPARRPPPA
jgi:4-amino-4-deoxy-L-arabinose transferase-like glycosyltransferase